MVRRTTQPGTARLRTTSSPTSSPGFAHGQTLRASGLVVGFARLRLDHDRLLRVRGLEVGLAGPTDVGTAGQPLVGRVGRSGGVGETGCEGVGDSGMVMRLRW